MDNRKLAVTVSTYVNKPATCYYNGKQRTGHINSVKQGPARRMDTGEFTYQNSPDGDVYVDWLERGDKKCKSFRWDKVIDFYLIPSEEAAAVAIESKATLVVKRVRPTLGV